MSTPPEDQAPQDQVAAPLEPAEPAGLPSQPPRRRIWRRAWIRTREGWARFRGDPRGALRRAWLGLRDGSVAYLRQPATFGVLIAPLLVVSILIYTRSLWTNYIFDEQEALLANPYVNGKELRFWQVFERDFWGLPPERTIGTYRPIPNIIWWLVWKIKHHAWVPHFVNVILHGVNAGLIGSIAFRWTGSRSAAWFCGLSLVLSAIVTEAIAGVVGLADVIGGTFILLCLWALQLRWQWSAVWILVFLFLGLLSKESTMTVTPIVGWTALVIAPLLHPERPRRWVRFVSVMLASAAAVIAYTYFRRHFFPVKLPAELQQPLADTEPVLKWAMHEFLRWFQQPKFATDPINNPLAAAEPALRIAGALRVYFRSLVQIVFPWQLSGDYSFPQEPAPERVVFPESVLGALLMVVPPIVAVAAWGRGIWLEFTRRWQLRQWSEEALLADGSFQDSAGRLSWLTPKLRGLAIIAVGALWVPLTYFPQSNIPLIMPTVRAERFWYVPILGSSLLIGWGFMRLWQHARLRNQIKFALAFTLLYFGFQATRGRMHALDYRNDLAFWRATAKAVPNSGKAHLNYGVMLGARQRLDLRLEENRRALELAPQWPMANIYYGDTLCRLHRSAEAIPHYKRGFELGPNDQFMIALALQCLWDEKVFDTYKDELKELSGKFPGSWVAYLVNDMITNGEKHNGVDPQYRPRGYNQGPRKK